MAQSEKKRSVGKPKVNRKSQIKFQKRIAKNNEILRKLS